MAQGREIPSAGIDDMYTNIFEGEYFNIVNSLSGKVLIFLKTYLLLSRSFELKYLPFFKPINFQLELY